MRWRTIGQTLGDLAEDERKVFWPGAQEHPNENSVRLYETGVHRRPR